MDVSFRNSIAQFINHLNCGNGWARGLLKLDRGGCYMCSVSEHPVSTRLYRFTAQQDSHNYEKMWYMMKWIRYRYISSLLGLLYKTRSLMKSRSTQSTVLNKTIKLSSRREGCEMYVLVSYTTVKLVTNLNSQDIGHSFFQETCRGYAQFKLINNSRVKVY